MDVGFQSMVVTYEGMGFDLWVWIRQNQATPVLKNCTDAGRRTDPYGAVKKLPKNNPNRTMHTPSYNMLIVFGSLTHALKRLVSRTNFISKTHTHTHTHIYKQGHAKVGLKILPPTSYHLCPINFLFLIYF